MRCAGTAALAALIVAMACGGKGDGPPRVGPDGGAASSGTGGSGGDGGSAGSGGTGGSGGYGAVDAGTAPTVEWVRRIGGSGDDQAFDMKRGAAGEVYVIGTFSDTVDFGLGPETATSFYTDAFVARLDTQGNTEWVRTFGGPEYDSLSSIALDGDGNLFISGSTSGSVDLGTGPTPFGGDQDLLVAKLTPDGNAIWVKAYGSTGYDVAGSLQVDASGAVVFGGSFGATVDFGGGARTASGKADAVVVKLDSGGNWIWDHTFGEALDQQDYARTVALDASGNVYVVAIVALAADDLAFSVRKLDPDGTPVWVRPYGQDHGHNRAESVIVSGSNVFVSGWGEQFPLGSATFSGADDDPVLVSFAADNGDVQWFREWHGAGDDHIYGMTLFGSDILTTGRIADDISFEGVEATQGCQDGFLARFAPDGSPKGAVTFGGTDCRDYGRSLAAYDATRILLCGSLEASVTLFGKPTAANGGSDAFVALLAMP